MIRCIIFEVLRSPFSITNNKTAIALSNRIGNGDYRSSIKIEKTKEDKGR